jgi:hypothetical protein
VAAKSKVAPKAAKKPVAAVKTKVKAQPKGLVYSKAQWAKYNKAYAVTARRLALAFAAQAFRKYRLQSAYATVQRANVATRNAQAAAIAAYATKQSWRQAKLAHPQNNALNARIELDAYNHANLAGRLQFAQGGERAYAHKAVMRTVDTAQATSYEQAIFAAAARVAKKAKKSVSKKGKQTAASKAVAKAANAAGAEARGKGTPLSSKASAAKAKAKRTAKAHAKATVAKKRAARKASHAKSAQSKKAPVTKAKARTAPYQGFIPMRLFDGESNEWGIGLNDFEGTCIMAAVANALWHQTGWRLPDEDIAYWTGRAGPHPDIGGVLNMLWTLQPWPQVKLLQPIPLVPSYEAYCERLIGFGDHAAYAFQGKMVSYGRLQPVAENADEVCTLEFHTR